MSCFFSTFTFTLQFIYLSIRFQLKSATMGAQDNTQQFTMSATQVESKGAQLMSLPPELHLQISQYLTFPDALSLKQSNKYFQSMVYTGIRLKIEWLIERRRLHLECPNNVKCDLGSDLKFCRGSVPYVFDVFVV